MNRKQDTFLSGVSVGGAAIGSGLSMFVAPHPFDFLNVLLFIGCLITIIYLYRKFGSEA